jgi:hypothetical protein
MATNLEELVQGEMVQ